MALSLGKRKRPEPAQQTRKAPKPEPEEEESDDDVRARFQRAFEAKFKPLAVRKEVVKPVANKAHSADQDDDVDEAESKGEEMGSDWDGISEDEDAVEVEVIEHGPDQRVDFEALRREKKAFMSSKPPSSQQAPGQTTAKKPSATSEADDSVESANLKNDLNLQRLLKESHLLDPGSFGAGGSKSAVPEGKARLKAFDLRLEDLGAKKGLMRQQKMPLAHLRGIRGKAVGRESKRRVEAKENGIILEKAKGGGAVGGGKGGGGGGKERRDRGMGGPGVGKFRGGTLSLSKGDVKAIKGGKKSGGGGKGKRR